MNSAALRVSNNEKDFIQAALQADLRIDGRKPFDARRLHIQFSKQDGAVEVQQGDTRVMAVVTGQLGPPYPDRPTEGLLSIYTEFSPMADPSFEPGRPGEMAIEMGRIIDRGLRESRAVDTESLCVLAGRAVWALRIDIHILDNGGNLVDAANVAALAALSSYRRPECSVGGTDGQEITVHPPEVREPIPLIIHHLPIAVTFAFFGDGDLQVIDPSLKEEAVMGGRLTVTVNAQGDICAMQKGGGVGVNASEIMRCVRIASSKASEVTNHLKTEIEANNAERSKRKVKRHQQASFQDVSEDKPDRMQEDALADESAGTSVMSAERKDTLMKIINEVEMEELEDSEDEDVDLTDGLEERKRKVETEPWVAIASKRTRVPDTDAQSSRKGLFEGGSSVWDDDDIDLKLSGKSLQKRFDVDATAEFESAARKIARSLETTERNSLIDGENLARMPAAAVYAQITDQSFSGPTQLGPTVGDKNHTLSSLKVLSGVELKPSPTSLADAVKSKRKKSKDR